jgi:hypothetical protein
MILKLGNAFGPGTASTAEVVVSRLHPVAYDLGTTGLTNWSKHSDGALETVEGVSFVVRDNFKSFMISIAAFVASLHKFPPGSLILGKDKEEGCERESSGVS